MSPRRRSPRPLSLALAGAEQRWAPATPLSAIQSVWADAVGALLAVRAAPSSYRSGVLTVSCSASVWAAELDLSSSLILGRLAELAPQVVIARLRCVCDGEDRGRSLKFDRL